MNEKDLGRKFVVPKGWEVGERREVFFKVDRGFI